MRAALLLVALAACVDHEPSLVTGTQSLQVDLITPTNIGTSDQRLDSLSSVQIEVTALDAQGQTDTTVTRAVDVYVEFLGTLSPDHEAGVPLTKITMNAGVSAPTTITLPPVYGPTVIWVEDVEGASASFALGATPTIWVRDPFVADIQRPLDETAVNAFIDAPLDGKQVAVSKSRYGAMGRLVVNGVYATGYTLDDVKCADANGTPPCVAGDYDHAFIYSFSRAKDQNGDIIALGETISAFDGASSEFNGLTEINFPQSFVDDATKAPDVARISPPKIIDQTWFSNLILFERNEAGLVEVDGATVCPLDNDYTKYSQWKLDIGLSCNSPINVVTAGQVPFDPTPYIGKVIPKVIGTMRPVNKNFNVWIIDPRFSQDLVLQ